LNIEIKMIHSLVTPRGIMCSHNCDFLFDAECLPAVFHCFACHRWVSLREVASVGSLLEVSEVETTVSCTTTQPSIIRSILVLDSLAAGILASENETVNLMWGTAGRGNLEHSVLYTGSTNNCSLVRWVFELG
jgi:hypothetical protein